MKKNIPSVSEEGLKKSEGSLIDQTHNGKANIKSAFKKIKVAPKDPHPEEGDFIIDEGNLKGSKSNITKIDGKAPATKQISNKGSSNNLNIQKTEKLDPYPNKDKEAIHTYDLSDNSLVRTKKISFLVESKGDQEKNTMEVIIDNVVEHSRAEIQ